MTILTLFGKNVYLLDILALLWFAICWWGYSRYADFSYKKTHSIVGVMNQYRLQWMRQMMKRDNRMVDASLIGTLVRSISFFASTSILVIAGLATMLRYSSETAELISVLPMVRSASQQAMELKVLLMELIFIYAFFKFTWSVRQHNYTGILIGAAPAPNDTDISTEDRESYIKRAAALAGNAARHFNMGVRAYYFGMAALSWFVHPLLFMLGSVWVVYVLYRREFHSYALELIYDKRMDHV